MQNKYKFKIKIHFFFPLKCILTLTLGMFLSFTLRHYEVNIRRVGEDLLLFEHVTLWRYETRP